MLTQAHVYDKMADYEEQEWKNSGSSCFTPFRTCLLAWCCPCVLYGRTRHRVKENGNMTGYSCCNSSCAAFCGFSLLGISFVLPMISRGDMREKYHLKGNACTDCLCAYFCGPCDLVQQDKEAELRERESLNMQPARHEPMNYAQQSQNIGLQQQGYVKQLQQN